MELKDIPQESKLKLETTKGWEFFTFHHLDGMYSYITRNSDKEVFHLAFYTPLKKVKDYYIIKE